MTDRDQALLSHVGATSALITARTALAVVASCPNHATAILTLQAWVDRLEQQQKANEDQAHASTHDEKL